MPFDLIDETDSIWYKRGYARGVGKVLIIWLDRRFGPLPDSVRQRVTSASIDQLEQWIDRFEVARQLSDVFDS